MTIHSVSKSSMKELQDFLQETTDTPSQGVALMLALTYELLKENDNSIEDMVRAVELAFRNLHDTGWQSSPTQTH